VLERPYARRCDIQIAESGARGHNRQPVTLVLDTPARTQDGKVKLEEMDAVCFTNSPEVEAMSDDEDCPMFVLDTPTKVRTK